VDAWGRAGNLERAEHVAAVMAPENVMAWIALLSACRLKHDRSRAENALKQIQKLKPMDSASFVLMASIYAKLGNWHEHAHLLNLMKEQKVKKIAGVSWLILHGQRHTFHAHERDHPALNRIREFSKQMVAHLKQELGYCPDTSWVSKELTEEEKEDHLYEHSERYAMYYGLLELPLDEPIIIFKNLRVCGDCHTYTALVSKATQREIRLRDAATWHVFKDGKCCCYGNY
jgi:hypothetical protein